jgi:hypothetical protein
MQHTLLPDNWLTVHRSITLVNFQLDAQNSDLFIYNTFIKISTCFDHCPAHLQEVYVVNVYMSSFLTGAQDSHLQRVTIPEAAYTQLRCRPTEDEQDNARNM